MAVYGPATGHYSRDSIVAARKTGGKGGDRLVSNSSGGYDLIKDPTGTQKRPTLNEYGNYTYKTEYASDGRQSTAQSQETNSQYSDIQSQMKALADAKRQSQIAGLSKSRDNALAGLDTQKAAIEPYYYDKRNQAAARSDVGAMNFAQYMAGRGVQGNAGAMPEMYRNAGLQSQIGALDQQQASDLAGIERNRANINTNYESDVAAANADIDAQQLQNFITQMNADRSYQAQQDALKQEQEKYKTNQYISTIGANSNDYQAEIDRLRALGYKDDSAEVRSVMAARNEKLQKEQEQIAAAQASQYENDPSYATALQAYNRGIRTDQVLRILGLK